MKKNIFTDEQALVKFLSKSNVNRLEIFSNLDFGYKQTKMTKLFCLMRDHDFENADELRLTITYNS